MSTGAAGGVGITADGDLGRGCCTGRPYAHRGRASGDLHNQGGRGGLQVSTAGIAALSSPAAGTTAWCRWREGCGLDLDSIWVECRGMGARFCLINSGYFCRPGERTKDNLTFIGFFSGR
jgi:hypothetical protein